MGLWRLGRLPIGSSSATPCSAVEPTLRSAAHDVRLQPYVELPAQIDVFESRFAGKRRTEFRRKWRRLQEAGAEMKLVSDPDEAPQARRATARPASCAAPRRWARTRRRWTRDSSAFITDRRGDMLPDGVRLWTLEIDGRC